MLLSKRLKLWELLIELANTHQLGDGSDMEEGRMLEWVLGCKGRSLDSTSVVKCSNPADEALRCYSGWYRASIPADWSFWVKSKLNYRNWAFCFWEMNQRQEWSERMMIVQRCEC